MDKDQRSDYKGRFSVTMLEKSLAILKPIDLLIVNYQSDLIASI
jgi:hypothetical protein